MCYQDISYTDLQVCQLQQPTNRETLVKRKTSSASTSRLLSLKGNTFVSPFTQHYSNQCKIISITAAILWMQQYDATTEIFHAVCVTQQEWFILETVYVKSSDHQES